MSDRIPAFVKAMRVRPTDHVLEIGCGHGIAATLVCEALTKGKYVGLDRSRRMLDAAATRNAGFVQSGTAEFVEGAFEEVDLGKRRFDKIFAMRVGLFHREPERATQLAKRWLAPGGKLFVAYDEPGAK